MAVKKKKSKPVVRRKKVVVQLPGSARIASGSLASRYKHELEALRPAGIRLVEVQTSTEDELIEGSRDADALITSWGIKISKRVIAGLDRCVVIGVGSVGVDMVDIAAATEAGIVVTNVPDVFIEEVADHAMMMLLASARRAREMDVLAREQRWFEGRPLLNETPRLWGQTLGLVAFGNVARAVARRAKPFGFKVIAADPYVTELKMTGEGVEPVGLNELLERSDYISVHAPLNNETRHLLSTAQFKKMKKTAIVVNTSRGPLIDEKALIKALRQGEIAGAGLDVLEKEPPNPRNPLLKMPNVLLSPHIASASTRMRPQTRRRVGYEVALALGGRWPMSCVNPTVLPRAPLERWQPVPMERGPNR